MDNFALLQEPRQPWLDPDSLKANFLRLAARLHPDKVHQAGADDKAAANERYAGINAAYHCLLEPKERLLHLLELESGAKPKDVQSIPPGTMDLLVEIGQVCRETDLFLAARNKTESPLLKAQMFETGMAWTDKLNQLRQRIDLRREELLAELKSMNTAWNAAPPPGSAGRAAALPLERLEQVYRVFSYMARWTEQIQERLVRLSF
jgi:DnaJ-domain-containing protein 1